MTVPLLESNVSPPVLVSIVLSFATPIRTLSIVAPPSASRRPTKVETPDTFKLSSSVCPVTSIPPFASIKDANVDTPETLSSSSSVCPSTSMAALISRSEEKVETPTNNEYP